MVVSESVVVVDPCLPLTDYVGVLYVYVDGGGRVVRGVTAIRSRVVDAHGNVSRELIVVLEDGSWVFPRVDYVCGYPQEEGANMTDQTPGLTAEAEEPLLPDVAAALDSLAAGLDAIDRHLSAITEALVEQRGALVRAVEQAGHEIGRAIDLAAQ